MAFGFWQTERNESKPINRCLMRKIALVPTVAEIRSLIAKLLMPPLLKPTFILAWSHWRRKHQAQAMIAHYKKRTLLQL